MRPAARPLADNLPTSGLAVLDFAADDWSDVAFRRGRLALFVTPRLLKANFRRMTQMRLPRRRAVNLC